MASECTVNSPIVIVPGILGSQLEGRLAKANHIPHWFCPKDSDWYTLWLSIDQLLPWEVGCFSDNVMLHYDNKTGTFHNTDGVETRIPGFGNTTHIEYLDPHTKYFVYFHTMVQHFVDKGYVRGRTIVGAPYDWRYTPDLLQKQGYFSELKTLIEKTYAAGGDKRVVVIVHSMGAPVTLYFLTDIVDQVWKDKYLKAFVTISGVWRGAANALKAFVSGQNEGIIIDLPIWGRAAQRTYPSTAFLMPPPTDTWPRDRVLIVTPQRNYTAWDYQSLFDDISFPRGYQMFADFGTLTSALTPPNVTTYAFYGHQFPTPEKFVYTEGEFPDTEPEELMGDGDGTVNLVSLEACRRWAREMNYDLTMVKFADVEHVNAIKNAEVIQHVDDVVCNLKN